MTIAQTASTIMHEVGSHQYFAIKDPYTELGDKKRFEKFREDRAYGQKLMAGEAHILDDYDELRGNSKGSSSPGAAGKT